MTASMRQSCVTARTQPAAGPLHSSLEFGAYPEAVASARLHARVILAEWGLGGLADDAEYVTGELMANAVQAHQREGLDAPVRLTLLAGAPDGLRTALITVRDKAGGTPAPGSPGEAAEHGRGLLIVNALSDWWDTRPCPGGGKVVRALLAEPAPSPCARDGT